MTLGDAPPQQVGSAEAAAPLLSPNNVRSQPMRALIVLLALVAAPYVAGVSQGRPGSGSRALKGSSVSPADVSEPGLGHDDAHCAMRADLHPDKDINKCDADPTPPP